jgi:hypothetical protein
MDFRTTNAGLDTPVGWMNASRIFYRTCQFWQALGANLSPEDLDLVREVLAPSQRRLFEQLQMSEKVHSMKVLRALLDQGENHPDLFVAALLHDVGKSRFPLNMWDRILIVVGKAFFPQRAKRWGSEPVSALESLHSSDRRGLPTETLHEPDLRGLPTEALPNPDRQGLPTETLHKPDLRGLPTEALHNPDRRGLLTETFLRIWRRPFIIAERHPAWGAEMAAQAGASPLAVALIRQHQDKLDPDLGGNSGMEGYLLRKLQAVDDNS